MSRKQYFDELSSRWDGMIDMPRVIFRLRLGLACLGIGFDEQILDLGCGTGNLSLCLLELLGSGGRVHAVDISPKMLEHARKKLTDPRMHFHNASAKNLPVKSSSLDRIICFSTWPHISDPSSTLVELHRILGTGGWLHVWHIDSRDVINDIHIHAGKAVQSDLLPPASALADTMEKHDFSVQAVVDSDYQYLISAKTVAS